jgi:hypothetical protein
MRSSAKSTIAAKNVAASIRPTLDAGSLGRSAARPAMAPMIVRFAVQITHRV